MVIHSYKHEKYHADIEDSKLTAADQQELVARFKALIKERTGKEFPQDPWKQLWGAAGAVFGSWMNDRAIVYRRKYGIPSEWGTAVNVQAMVYGNTGDTSGSGVAFTRNPANGVKEFYGEFLINAQGEDVVAGVRTPEPVAQLAKEMPAAYKELDDDPRDAGEALQGRAGLRVHDPGRQGVHAPDAQRQAHGVGRAEVLDGHGPGEAHRLEDGDPPQPGRPARPAAGADLRREGGEGGQGASPRACRPVPARPPARCISTRTARTRPRPRARRCCWSATRPRPEDLRGMIASEGILTAKGGVSSHAALVARQMGKVCVCGAGALQIDYAAKTMTVGRRRRCKEGDFISINGTLGDVYAGRDQDGGVGDRAGAGREVARRQGRARRFRMYDTLMKWCSKVTQLQVRTNADTPEQTENAIAFGATGIGLTPHRAHVLRRQPHRRHARDDPGRQRRGPRRRRWPSCCRTRRRTSTGIFQALKGYPATIRFLDPPLHEFLPHEDAAQQDLAEKMGVPRREDQAAREGTARVQPDAGLPRLPPGHRLSGNHRDAGPRDVRSRGAKCRRPASR